ncbi:MAG: hypothetical protein FIB01_00570 [Gemmatimonadetes bacterium]|nr:hypothetical protein [Gemmatimonadota bacterium]
MTSKRIIRIVLGIALIPALGWLVPASLWGQATTFPAAAAYVTATPAELESMAEDLASSPDRFGEAGDLLAQAAHKLAVEDAASVALLIRAARLQYFGGALADARANMKEAGWRALGQGSVRVAANAYADAALIAVAQHDNDGAIELGRVVKLLAQWPGVSVADARQIRSRID